MKYQQNKSKKISGKLKMGSSSLFVPISVFSQRDVGVLESLCVFLKDKCSLRYCEIAHALHRDQRTIWNSYQKAKVRGR